VDDATITAQVKTKLASDLKLSTITNIDVDTTNGVVTLAGQVENEHVRSSAEQIASAVEGVVSVNNNLQIEAAGVRN
jgi:osmotically-inducible protein OsmY